MIEKVNPMHPDKIADRIAGALVDMAYELDDQPKIAVEVLIGHGDCHIIAETTVHLDEQKIEEAVRRIVGRSVHVSYKEVEQDAHLAKNQAQGLRCGDNGIFKGVPLTNEQKAASLLAREIYERYETDGKYILDGEMFICCQSHAKKEELIRWLQEICPYIIKANPLGDWTGGIDVDTGATNRKLGSDMADSVTGGGLHGKDLSKADVAVNICAFLKAQETGETITARCAIGDDHVDLSGDEDIDLRLYSEIVETARKYIQELGGFEKFAEWGLY